MGKIIKTVWIGEAQKRREKQKYNHFRLKYAKEPCAVCGYALVNCDIHHIRPVRLKGNNDRYNLVNICPNCHRMTKGVQATNKAYFLKLMKEKLERLKVQHAAKNIN